MGSLTQQQQIPFPFTLAEEMSFENFHAGDQKLLLDSCRQLVKGLGEEQLYIWGAQHAGKTHLLTACCQRAVEYGLRIAYLPADIIRAEDSLHGMEALDLVCIDNLQSLSIEGEPAVFQLINDMRRESGRLLLAANRAPSDLQLVLPDLVSRLSWGPVFQLQKLNDLQLREALQLRASTLGINLPPEVLDFILTRQPRDMRVLDRSLNRILDAAILSKRRLTIPLVKEVLGV